MKNIYLCFFICFIFRKIHIEIVSGLNAESSKADLKRFVARRETYAKLYSDNATNFSGNTKVIKEFKVFI